MSMDEATHRQYTFDEAEAQVKYAQEVVTGMFVYLRRLPQAPEAAHLLHECQRAQGHLARSLEQYQATDDSGHTWTFDPTASRWTTWHG